MAEPSAQEASSEQQLRQQQQQDRETSAGASPQDEEGKRLAAELEKDISRSKDVFVFIIAILLAINKDLADPLVEWIGTVVLPVVGTIIASVIESIIGLGIVWFEWWFLTSNGWFKESEAQIRFIYWAIAGFADDLPGIKELPLNTIVVLYAWSDIQGKAGISNKRLLAIQSKLTQRKGGGETPALPSPASA